MFRKRVQASHEDHRPTSVEDPLPKTIGAAVAGSSGTLDAVRSRGIRLTSTVLRVGRSEMVRIEDNDEVGLDLGHAPAEGSSPTTGGLKWPTSREP
jgi:hypothetical protein